MQVKTLLRISIVTAVSIVFAVACGSGEDNPYSADQLAGFLTELEAARGEQEVSYAQLSPLDIPEQVSDAGLGRGWAAGQRMQQLAPLPEIERILVTVELYNSTGDATRRYEGERDALVALFQRAAPSTRPGAFDVDEIGGDCESVALESPTFIPQYQVHCRVETLFIWARAIGQDAETAQALTIEGAREVVERAQAALPAEDTYTGS
jgi:hypothetical protein